MDVLFKAKYDNRFCCVHCGYAKATRGRSEFELRCANCKKYESLRKHTALSNSKISLENIISIRDILIDAVNFDRENERIMEIKGSERLLTISEYMDHVIRKTKWKKGDTAHPPYNDAVQRAVNKRIPSVRKISAKLNIEENSISKLLKAIDDRIPTYELDRYYAYYPRIRQYLEMSKCPEESFNNLIMLPLVGKWEEGINIVNNRYYGISEFRSNWHITPLLCRMNEQHTAIVAYMPDPGKDIIEYGSEMWKALFCKTLIR